MHIEIDYSINQNRCLLKTDNSTLLGEIREKFSVSNKAAAYQSRFAPRRLYAVTPAGKFESGLLVDIIKEIKESAPSCNITLTREAKEILDCGFESDLIFLDNNLELRYYQEEILKNALRGGKGVCVLGTGGGKTLTIATLIHNIIEKTQGGTDFRCLLLVPDRGLVQQTYSDFVEYNVPFTFCRWTSQYKLETDVNVVIASNQIVQSQFEQQSWIEHVDLVVIDEAHKIKHKNKIGKLISKIYTNNKYGFTGTLPEEQLDRWSIIGKTGQVYYEKGSNELREEGFLTSAEVKVVKIEYKKKPKTYFKDDEFTSTARYKAELDFLYESEYRNKVIKQISGNFKNNILILVNHISHGELLLDILNNIPNREVYFVQGSVDVDDREKIKKSMEDNHGVICIAMSSIFSTGINIKNIHMIIFASGGKAFIRLVQSIGRGLRKHHSKEKLIIIDLADQLHYGISHLNKRLEIYKRENIPFNISTIKEP